MPLRTRACWTAAAPGKPWNAALPVLLRRLPRIDDPSLNESIVRCLSVPWIGNHATAPEFTAVGLLWSVMLLKPPRSANLFRIRDNGYQMKIQLAERGESVGVHATDHGTDPGFLQA